MLIQTHLIEVLLISIPESIVTINLCSFFSGRNVNRKTFLLIVFLYTFINFLSIFIDKAITSSLSVYFCSIIVSDSFEKSFNVFLKTMVAFFITQTVYFMFLYSLGIKVPLLDKHLYVLSYYPLLFIIFIITNYFKRSDTT